MKAKVNWQSVHRVKNVNLKHVDNLKIKIWLKKLHLKLLLLKLQQPYEIIVLAKEPRVSPLVLYLKGKRNVNDLSNFASAKPRLFLYFNTFYPLRFHLSQFILIHPFIYILITNHHSIAS